MEEVPTQAHLAIDVDLGGLSSLFPYDADAANACRSMGVPCSVPPTTCRSYRAFD